MDNCVVCCKSNEDVLSRINTISSEWKEWNIRRIIEKHLWWWYFPRCNNGTEQWICRQCWHELSSFHSFFIEVEKAHKKYEQVLLPFVKRDTDEGEAAAVDIKVEDQHLENKLIFADNVIHLEKPKRGRKQKKIENPESIQMLELPVAQVKCENDTSEAIVEYLSVKLLENGEDCPADWGKYFLNEIENVTKEENKVKAQHDRHNLIFNKKIKRNIKTKFKAVSKSGKKCTKSKKEKQNVMKKRKNLNAMKEYDDFIADSEFLLYCSICSVSLSDFNNLRNHFRKEHDTLGYAMCCNKKFYKRGVLVDHLNVHKCPEYFKCLQCKKSFPIRQSYVKHMETHQLYETRQYLYNCDKCDKSFVKKSVFDRHVLTHIPEEEKKIQCSLCDKKFASECLRKHHYTLTHSKKYAKFCDICGKLLNDNFSFDRHMKEHNGEKPAKVECDICGIELTNKYRLNRHKKMMHTEKNQQEQICPHCSKVSPNIRAHRHHVKYIHIQERKHACNMCDKKFRRPLELREHLSTHTGEPLYTCPHCPRTFISSANMHKHRKFTHRKEWEEGKIKKEARVLAGKNFLKTLNATENKTLCPKLGIIEPK